MMQLCRIRYILPIGILLGLLGATLFVAFGIKYLKPYLKTRYFLETMCTVIASDVISLVRCTCTSDSSAGSRCVSMYPCLQVRINYTMLNGEGVSNATVFDSFPTLQLQKERLDHQKCSFHKCDRVASRNNDYVKQSREQYGLPGQQFQCYYLPGQNQSAIMDRISGGLVGHAFFWSSLFLLLGGCILTWIVIRVGKPKRSEDEMDFAYEPAKVYFENRHRSLDRT